MIQQGFWIGDRDWWIMVSYDISGTEDLNDVYVALLASGCPDYKAQRACMVLSNKDKGYTWSNYDGRFSAVFISRGTSAEQVYDSCDHELKHLVEHISEYYDVDPRSEEAAYLQGEIARKMFPAVAMLICPKCHEDY